MLPLTFFALCTLNGTTSLREQLEQFEQLESLRCMVFGGAHG